MQKKADCRIEFARIERRRERRLALVTRAEGSGDGASRTLATSVKR